MPTATIDAHNEDLEDGTSILFPAATVACNAGDYIVANIGTATSYVGASGTITFGQFWNGTAWTGTGSPYTNVPITWNMEDEAFADVEILATIDFFADPHTGEFPVHSRSGHHAIHGGHIRPKAVGKRHTHPHHQTKHHWHNVVFSTSATNTVAGTCTVNVTLGYLQLDDGTLGNNGNPFPNTSIPNVPKDTYFVFNNTGAAVDGIAARSFGFLASTTDFTTDGRVNHHIIGRVSSNVDTHTGQYYLEGWHANAHQHHGTHAANGAVGKRHEHTHKKTAHHFHNIVFSTSAIAGSAGTYTTTVSWTAGTITWHNGGTDTVGAGSLASVPQDAYIVYNPSFYPTLVIGGQTIAPGHVGFCPGSSDFTLDSSVSALEVGRVSTAPDAQSGQLYVEHMHGGSHQHHGAHIAGNAVDGDVHVKKNGHIREAHVGQGELHGGESGHVNHVAAQAIDGGTAHDHIAHQSIHGGESGNADHHAPQSHARRHQNKALPHRYHADGVVFSVSNTSGGTCTVAWTGPGDLWADDNTGHTINAGSYTGVPNGAYLGYNTTGTQVNSTYGTANFFPANGIGWVTASNDFSQPSQDAIIVLGRLSASTDPQTGQYVFHHHMGGAHQVHGGQIAASAVDGIQHVKQNGNIRSGHIGSSQIQSTHVASSQIHTSHLSGYGNSSVLITSSQWTWTPTKDAVWHLLNFQQSGGNAVPGTGSSTSGNLSPWNCMGSDATLQAQLMGADGTWGVYDPQSGVNVTNGWMSVEIVRKALNGTTATFGPLHVTDAGGVDYYQYLISTDAVLTVVVGRFEALSDNTAAVQFFYNFNSNIGVTLQAGVRWRLVSGISS